MNDPVRIPKRLKQRPHWRGMPIPYIALIDGDGKPDFRVTDEAKRISVIKNRLCQLCGQPLGRYFFFVGGTQAAEANAYFEPATHLDCLIYAMQVCPFIAGKIEHADIAKVQADHGEEMGRYTATADMMIKADDNFSVERNPYWVIKKAVAWKYGQTRDGTLLLVPEVVKTTEPLHAETMTAEDWGKVTKELLT